MSEAAVKTTKDSKGKLSYELDWEFVEGMAQRMSLNKGNGKYDKFGWRDRGVNVEEMEDAVTRHFIAIRKGELDDDGQKYGHYYAICCDIMIILNQLKKNQEVQTKLDFNE